MKRFLAAIVFLLAAAAAVAAPPRLVVVISIDQFPSYYLTRYANVLGDDGFRRLEREGTRFVNAAYPYAVTFTGPGHASIGTGRTPSESGIVSNTWFDRATGKPLYCVADPGAEPDVRPGTAEMVKKANRMSPRNLDAPSLGDALQAHDHRSKVYSVSLKDRAAILMGGRNAWGAFWLDPRIGFTTTKYYKHRLPALRAAFNKDLTCRVKTGMQWELDPRTKEAHVTDPPELRRFKTSRPGIGVEFPHPVASLEQLTYTPFGNDLVLDFARRIIAAEELGRDAHPDVLFVSLSSPDYLGHAFGPDSWEAADTVVRTDRQLAKFIAELRTRFGTTVTLALTADHGVQSIPEVAKAKEPSQPAGRVNLEAPATWKPVEALAAQKLGLAAMPDLDIKFEEPALYFDFRKLPPALSAEQVKAAFREAVLTVDGVNDAFTSTELAAPESASDSHDKKAMRLSFRADRSGDVLITLKAGYIWDYGGTGTTHGQPVPDDERVPVIVWGKGIVHGDERCRAGEASPLDLARTLGKLLGVDAGGAHSHDLDCARAR